jgi:hypothetical protein
MYDARGSSRQESPASSWIRSSTQATTSLPLTIPSGGTRAPTTTRAGTRSRVATSAIAARVLLVVADRGGDR